MILLLCCGGRDYADRERVREVLAEYLPEEPIVMHGGQRGADTLVHVEAEDLGITVVPLPADWDRYGRAAGPIRNREMLDRNPNLVVAFPGGKGTEDTVVEAERRGIWVRRITPRAKRAPNPNQPGRERGET